ncbi:hypothetical protein PsYK624_081540 [Phanerochaete sordida]|uniref:Fungal-type protein kinase domain-containing protein n=1 Tax=Phanerochaete sordida TaxID=48140 RepID=A0A9P3GBU4_9APHY|nr:hypothetical protein PsYK624_081540 [Phanerochaete sordida]
MSIPSDPFLGLMPPQVFLDQFMVVGNAAGTPQVSFSEMYSATSSRGMGEALINCAEKSNICPGVRFFLTRSKKWNPTQASASGNKRTTDGDHNLAPTIGARKQPQQRRGRRKKRDIVEYCDFVTFLLGVETQCDADADPFLSHEELGLSPPPSVAPRTPEQQTKGRSTQQEHASLPNSCAPSHASPGTTRQDAETLVSSTHEHPCDSGEDGAPGSSAQDSDRYTPPVCTPGNPYGISMLPIASSPDSAGTSTSDVSQHTHTLSPKSKCTLDGRSMPWLEAIELRVDEQCDPPTRSSVQLLPTLTVEKRTQAAERHRAALLSHVQAQFLRQHRCFLFHVLIFGRYARFLRFDRSGGIVSDRFNYVDEPAPLAQFFWRFAHLTDEQRGWDPSVSLPNRKEKALFVDAVRVWLAEMQAGTTADNRHARRLPDAERTLDDGHTYPTWKVHVVNEATGASSDLLVQRPFAGEMTLYGRSTRAYIAYDLTTRRLVFFKDSWRADRRHLRPEFQTFQDLEAHHVPNVPPALYGGDVLSTDGGLQETVKNIIAADNASWHVGKHKLRRHVHHRIVQDIAYPLESARDAQEFVQAIHGALCALQGAYQELGFLHRDVSFRNVMITPEGRGILNDWDHSGPKDRRAPPIGTWKFMSASMLENTSKINEIIDDLESILWVLLYGALHHFGAPGQDVPEVLFDYQNFDKDGSMIGGLTKKVYLLSDDVDRLAYTDAVLQELILHVTRSWSEYHAARATGSVVRGKEQAEAAALLARASQPKYWVDMFAKALKKFGERRPSTIPLHDRPVVPGHAPSSTGIKRKNGGVDRNEWHGYDAQHPRRSKRLRLQMKRAR